MTDDPTPIPPTSGNAEKRLMLKKHLADLAAGYMITSTTGCVTHIAVEGELELVPQPPHKTARN